MNPQDGNNKPMQMSMTLSPSESQLIRSTLFPGMMPAMTGPMPVGMGSNAPTMTGLLYALKRRWALALIAAVAAAIIGIGGVLIAMPMKYTVQAAVQIHSKAQQKLLTGGPDEDPEFAIFKGNCAARIKSPQVLMAAINKVKDLNLSIVRNPSGAVKWLEVAIKTDFAVGPEVLRVTLSADDPQEAATLLNAIVDAFIADMQDSDMQRRVETLQKLEENKKNAERDLAQKRNLLKDTCKRLGIDDPDGQRIQYANAQADLSLIKKDYRMTDLELTQARVELETLQTAEKLVPTQQIPDSQITAEVRSTDQWKGLSLKMQEIDAEIQAVRATAKNPDAAVAALLERIDFLKNEQSKLVQTQRPEIEKNLRVKTLNEVRAEILKAQGKISGAQKRKESLAVQVEKQEEEVKRRNPALLNVPAQVEELREKVIQQESALSKIGGIIQMILLEPSQASRITRWQPAEAPSGVDTTKQLKFGGAAGAGLFLLALFGVGYLELRSGRITGPEEVTRGLGMRIIGSLPATPPAAHAGVLTNAGKSTSLWENRLTEAVDAIRTFIMYTARTEKIRVVMVTSAGPGEGKTSLASQLAASLARAWRNTLLIDGDLRHPAAHSLFSLPLEPGFSEVLRGEATAADVIKPTSLGRLWLMPAGRWDDHAVQALAQDNVRALFDSLKQQYEFIIVDSAPVLSVADALSLGQNVDGVIYSVLRDVSRFPALQSAHQRLASLEVRTLGAVLIGSKHEGGSLDYQYSKSKERK